MSDMFLFYVLKCFLFIKIWVYLFIPKSMTRTTKAETQQGRRFMYSWLVSGLASDALLRIWSSWPTTNLSTTLMLQLVHALPVANQSFQSLLVYSATYSLLLFNLGLDNFLLFFSAHTMIQVFNHNLQCYNYHVWSRLLPQQHISWLFASLWQNNFWN